MENNNEQYSDIVISLIAIFAFSMTWFALFKAHKERLKEQKDKRRGVEQSGSSSGP